MKQSLITGLVCLLFAALTGHATAQELEEGVYRAALQYFMNSADPGTTFRLATSSDHSGQAFAAAAARALGIPVTTTESIVSCPSDGVPITECSLPEPNSTLVQLLDVGFEGGQCAQVRVVLHKQEGPGPGIYGLIWHLTLKQDPTGHWTVEDAVLRAMT